MPGYNRTLCLLLGICLAGACITARASAADPAQVIETVPTADLDLSSPAGKAVLHRRIVVAARNVCAWVDPGKWIDFEPFADCVRTAIHEASPQTAAVLAKARRTGVMVAGTTPGH